MRLALTQAALALNSGEVPVGALVVRAGQVIAVGANAPIGHHDPSSHAEMVALRAAALSLGNYRLDECELFVTLEPCAMCAGAMLHARLKRVVFGAPDPKTGAAGSVLDLFAYRQLNHHTQVRGGVLAAECAALLQDFFRKKRQERRGLTSPVREDAVRTPATYFDTLPDYPWPANYMSDLPALAGLRLHYLDEGASDAPLTYLCLHGVPAWSYFFRNMMPVLLAGGFRVVAPDLIGFGKSDKPKKEGCHEFTWHRQILLELVERLDLRNIVLVGQDWGSLLGLTLPLADERRYRGLLLMTPPLATGDMQGHRPMDAQARAAYNAPFPDRGHRAALRVFPRMGATFESSDAAALLRQLYDFWCERWSGQTLLAAGLQDPVQGADALPALQRLLRYGPDSMLAELAGDFVPEHAQRIARAALQYFVSSPTGSARS